MIKKLLSLVSCHLLLITCLCGAAGGAAPVSIFSTSTDWERVTGLRLSEYTVSFVSDSKMVGAGMELYFLDGFPCYGQPSRTRVWMGRDNTDDRQMLITCLYPPKNILLAWRNSERNSVQGTTTGMLNCPTVGFNELTVDLAKCVREKDWKDFE